MEWTGARYSDTPTAQVELWVAASPARVWSVLADIERMPSMSNELESVRWLDGATHPEVGARFEGRSVHAALGEWATVSEIIECEPERVLAWAVHDVVEPSAIWRFRLEPANGGTLLSEWVQLGPGRSGLSYAIDRMPDKEQKIVFVRMREFEENMNATLRSVKEQAEA